MTLLGLALGLVMGLTLGLLGGGGSILTVPIFVYVLGFEPKPAIAMSLAVVGAASLTGAIAHWRIGNVHPRVALVFGTVAMAGAYTGARLASLVSGRFQLTLFALVMLVAAYFMLRGRLPGVSGTLSRHVEKRSSLPVALIALQGVAVGALTGLVGVGGGFLIVPALVLLIRIPMKQAVGTSLAVITLNALAGFLGYIGQVEVRWGLMSAFGAMAIAGILLGTVLVRFVPQGALRQAFAVFLLLVAAAILYQNRVVFLAGLSRKGGVMPGVIGARLDPETTTCVATPAQFTVNRFGGPNGTRPGDVLTRVAQPMVG